MSSEIELLRAENERLVRQLEIARVWMQREIQQATHKIASKKVVGMTENHKDDFFRENQEQIIAKRIQGYF